MIFLTFFPSKVLKAGMAKASKHTIYLGTGSNLGHPEHNLTKARILCQECMGSLVRTSSLYRTAAWGIEDQPVFFNQVLCLETTLGPFSVLDAILSIEQQMGRVRQRKWGERLIDIDLLLYDQCIIRSPRLEVPHPYIAERQFVLIPLAEIAPDMQHPIHQRSIAELQRTSTDQLPVERVE